LTNANIFSIFEEMAEQSYLGEFELLIMLTVIHLGDEAYGVPISGEIEKYRGREISIGSVYAALDRLEVKGLVSSSIGNPTPERGGRAKRYFRVTRQGLRDLRQTRQLLTKLWDRLPELKEERA
jgi:PadR family transcriptional regulator, regulatory protein PadR